MTEGDGRTINKVTSFKMEDLKLETCKLKRETCN